MPGSLGSTYVLHTTNNSPAVEMAAAAALVRKYHARPSLVVITSASSLFSSSLGGVAGSGCQRRDYSQRKRSRDPRAVLNVSANASRDEIKASFRSLAKRYHPDLRMHLLHHNDDDTTTTANDDSNSNANADEIMTELITAYETLMQNEHEYNLSIVDARDSRVALACETYSLLELRGMHRTFDVYTFRIDFSCCSNDYDDDDDNDGNDCAMKSYNNESIMNKSSTTCSTLDPYPIFPLNVHPDDSISDLKRYIQARYGEEWGLSIGGQRVDRDGLYLGWELVHYNNRNNSNGVYSNVDDDNDGYRSGNDKDYGKVLSYHLFLSSYNIKEGDHVHAIVRRRDV